MFWRYGEVRRLVRRIAKLEEQLEAERERNRRREDELLNRVLTAKGSRALPPEPTQERPAVEQPITALDEARLTAYREAAVRAGRPANDGDLVWRAGRNGKPVSFGLPDEPYVLPS